MKLKDVLIVGGGLYLLDAWARGQTTIQPVPPPSIAGGVESYIQQSIDAGNITSSAGGSQIYSLQHLTGAALDAASYKYASLAIQANARTAIEASNLDALKAQENYLRDVRYGGQPYSSPAVQAIVKQIEDLHASLIAPFQAQLDALNASVAPALRTVLRVNA